MVSTVARGPVTNRILAELEEEGFPVGDNSTPDVEYGWSAEPNAADSIFTPWMMLTPLAAQQQRIGGALGDTGTEWVLPYTVFYAGVSRVQCEALADKMRAALCNIEREGVNTNYGDWRIQKISCTAMGSCNRVGSSYPDYYTQADSFDVWLSKERS